MRRHRAHLPLPTAQTHAMDAPLDLSRALGDASPQGGGQGPAADRLIGHTLRCRSITTRWPHFRSLAGEIVGDNSGAGIAKGRRMAPSMRMATARQATELRRWADLTVINGAFAGRMPDVLPADSGLKDVAELCKRDYAARPGRDWNEVRDQLLLIGIEWDLTRDRLDQQSQACLRAIATFLR